MDYDFDFGKIRFVQEYRDQRIEHEIRGDANLDELLEAFEHFLKGAGYHFPEGCHIGYEYDEKDEPADAGGWSMGPYNITINGEDVPHSQYYWDLDRNK